MRTSASRRLAKRLILSASGILFLVFWGIYAFSLRPGIEGRLLDRVLGEIGDSSPGDSLRAAFVGRDGSLRATFESEEERGRFQSRIDALSVPGVRRIETDLVVKPIEKVPPTFRFFVKSDGIAVSGIVGSAAEKSALLAALRTHANGMPVADQMQISEQTAPAPWVDGLRDFLPVALEHVQGSSLKITEEGIGIEGEIADASAKKAVDQAMAGLRRHGFVVEGTFNVLPEPETPTLSVKLEADKVIVEGLLPRGNAREIVISAVQRASQPGSVEDRLQIRERVKDAPWTPKVAELLAMLLENTSEPVLAISDREMVMSGEARDEGVRSQMEALLQTSAASAQLAFESRLTAPLPPPPMPPTRVMIVVGSGQLGIAGEISDDVALQEVLSIVRSGSGDVRLENELNVGTQIAPPEWLPEMRTFVPAYLRRTVAGELHIIGSQVKVKAEVRSEGDADVLETGIGVLREAGFSVEDPVVDVMAASAPVAETAEEPATQDTGAAAVPGLVKPPFLEDHVMYFGHNTAMFKGDDVARLRSMAGVMTKHPEARFVAAGYSDTTGNQEYNEWLCRRRAHAVRDVLVKNGVPGDRIRIESFGAEGPRASGKDDARLKVFRRVEILMEKSDSQPTASANPPTQPST